ncbi:MAG: cytidine deaminase [Myxococcota bacterium]
MIDSQKHLIERAKHARSLAYAPYSNFQVGAALLTEDGTIFEGCNVENSSFGLTVCAERSALLSAVSQGHRAFKAIAVITQTNPPASPCGACRQVLAEFAPNLPIIIASTDGQIAETNLSDLLPMQFRLK